MTADDQSLEATIQHTLESSDNPLLHAVDPRAPATELAPGAAVGRYTVLAKIGAGAMGIVYEAFDRDLDRRVAVKLLQRAESAELLGEAQAMAKLAHPHVVAVYDVGTVRAAAGNQVFVAMEFVAGGTLSQWLTSDGLEQAAILDAFVAAGQGLAAAHRANLVHGDFKPDNVLMTLDLAPKVTDFGLAHASGRMSGPSMSGGSGSLVTTPPSEVQTLGAGAATMAGTGPEAGADTSPRARVRLCGTPAYMAPEQFRGSEATEYSDQFSFCVALYEGLYGKRPFSGRSLVSLGAAICQNRRDPPPSDVVVPRRILDVIDRGLATNPDDRFADMDELLAALRPPVVERSAGRTWAIAAFGLLAGLGIGAGLLWNDDEPASDPCLAATASVDAVWTDDARRRLRGNIEATRGPNAASVADYVVAELDDYADALRAARTSACERRLGQQDTDRLHELRAVCLDERDDALAGLLDALETVDAAQLDNLGTAAARLPATAACDDTARLLAELPLPPDDQIDAVADLRHELARVRTLIDSGSPAATKAAEAAHERAQTLGYAPVVAEASFALGCARLADEQLEPAAQEFDRSYFEALRVGHDEIAAESAAELLFVRGVELGDVEAGLAWADHGLAIAERGHQLRARAEVLSALATLDRVVGKLDLAVSHSREVVELLEDELGPAHLDTGRAYGNHGVALIASGKPLDGLAWLERAAVIYTAKLGPTHHKLTALFLNLAGARIGLHDPDQDALALLDLERAEAIHQLGKASDKDLGFLRSTRAAIYIRQGRIADARADRAFVVEAFRDYYGAEHPIVADAEFGLALSHLLGGELERGQPLADQALATVVGLKSPPDVLIRAEVIAAAFACAGKSPDGVARFATAWQAFAQTGATADDELEMWLLANPACDPRD